jgi:dolichol kinase
MRTEIKRKLFHMVGMVYVAGVITLPRPAFLILMLSVLLGISCFEAVRLKNQKFNNWLLGKVGDYFRFSEENRPTSMLWMAFGVLVASLFPISKELVIACLLYLIFGDSAASLFGKGFGKSTWPYSQKTFVGSMACFLICLLIGVFFLQPLLTWELVVGVAFTVAFIESLSTRIDDNFLIPVGAALVFLVYSP